MPVLKPWQKAGAGPQFFAAESASIAALDPAYDLHMGTADYTGPYVYISTGSGDLYLFTAAPGDTVLEIGLPSEAHDRLFVNADGSLHWGDGTSATADDLILERSGPSTLNIRNATNTASLHVNGVAVAVP